MNVLSAENLEKRYVDKVLLDNVSFGIAEGDRIGLIGVNGTGKSTFLRLLAGLDWPDSGRITAGGNVRIHYLSQNPQFAPDSTVLQEVFHGDLPQMRLLRDYQDLLVRLDEDAESEQLQRQLIRLQAQMDEQQVWQLEHEAKTILTKLGVHDFAASVATLSGGQRKRVALARALIQPADLLLLDEPTNHIDDETVLWLETYLGKRAGALLLITHDRYFLDRVVNRIFELDFGKLVQISGNYQAFLEGKLAREASERASEEKRQNFLRNELEWIQKGPRARGTKQKARTDRYYETLEQNPVGEGAALTLSSVKSRLGKTVIELDHVSHGFGDRWLFRDFSYILLRADRIGIVGPNGSGKSTLLQIMAGQLVPKGGHVDIGATVRIGYFSQEHTDMNPDQRVIDSIRDVADYVETAAGELLSAAQMLERFLFPGGLQWAPIGKLSGGEKRRLVLLKTLMLAPNVLLLDEPTNDLDIPTLSVLESYLEEFAGAVVTVSHDRYFLDKVVDKVFAFEEDGRISRYQGDFAAYQQARQAKRPTQPVKDMRLPEPALRESGSGRPLTLKMTYKEQKEYEGIEGRIAAVEASLAQTVQRLHDAGGDYARVQVLFDEQQALEASLAQLMDRWTHLSELAEAISRNSAIRE